MITTMNLYEIRNMLGMGKTIFDLPLKVTFYARVSTDKYEQEKSLKDQVEYYEDLIKENINWEFIPGYIDEGISGTSTLKRESFLKMINDAKEKNFDLILTKEISRFSRNTLDSIRYTQELLGYNIGVFFQTDNINTFLPDSELRLTIMASMAQEEVRKLSERVKFGFQRSINNGRVLGNSSIWGYKKDNCKLIIDEEEAKIVRLIYEMYVNNHIGMRTIAKKLTLKGYKSKEGKDFSATTIAGILKNPKYKGYYCGNKTRVIDYRLKTKINISETDWIIYKDEETVPAIVSEELWNKAQDIINKRSSKTNPDKRVYQNRYVLSGKIKCAEHNTSFVRKVNVSSGIKKKKKINWACGEYIKHSKNKCDIPLIYEEELMEILKHGIKVIFNQKKDIVDNLVNEYKNNLSKLNFNESKQSTLKELNKLRKQKEDLLDLRLDNLITKAEFSLKNESLIQKEMGLKKELAEKEILKTEFKFDEVQIKRWVEKIVTEDINHEEFIRNFLDKIDVYKTDELNKLRLKIYLNLDIDNEIYFKGKKHQFYSDFSSNES